MAAISCDTGPSTNTCIQMLPTQMKQLKVEMVHLVSGAISIECNHTYMLAHTATKRVMAFTHVYCYVMHAAMTTTVVGFDNGCAKGQKQRLPWELCNWVCL